MNTLTISGNLVKDAKDIQKGDKEFISLRLANSYNNSTLYMDVLVCGGAVKFAKGAKSGTPVLVSGRLSQRDYTDKDGNKRVAYSVVAYEFEKLDHVKQAEEHDAEDLPF